MLEENTRAHRVTQLLLGKEERGMLSQNWISCYWWLCVGIPTVACAIEGRMGMWLQLVQPKAAGTKLQCQDE